MAFVPADRVKETTTTTGTGTYSLAGAAAGFRTFVAGVGTTNRCTYCVENGTDWEINEGVVTDAAPDTLTRARLLASSTGSAISWGAGTKNVFAVYAAADRNPRTRKLTADHAISSTTATEVTGLELTDLQPGTYVVRYVLRVLSATTTVGLGLGINFTGTSTVALIRREEATTGAAAATGVLDDVANVLTGSLLEARAAQTFSTTTPNTLNTGVATINSSCMITMTVLLIVTAVGNLELWHSSETATSTTVQVGSSVICTRIDD